MNERLPAKVRNRRQNIHKHARRGLAAVLDDHGCRCHWCGRPLVLASAFRGAVKVSNCYVRWRDCHGVAHKALFATADHLRRVADGGDNRAGNVVPACAPCNYARQAKHDDHEPWLCRCDCAACGGLKRPRDRVCHTCSEKADSGQPDPLKVRRLLDAGWDCWPDPSPLDPFFARWQDPVTMALKTFDYALYVQSRRHKYGRDSHDPTSPPAGATLRYAQADAVKARDAAERFG
jgi:hypothetical protein